MKNKDDHVVRGRIHDFADMRKNGNMPVDFHFSFDRVGLNSLIENDDALPSGVSEKSSVLYLDDTSEMEDELLEDYLEKYDLIFRNASKGYDLPKVSYSILNKYKKENQLQSKTKNVFYLGPKDSEERSQFLVDYVNDLNVFLSNNEAHDYINGFFNRHELEKAQVNAIPPVIFLLKSFDVVHCYGLEYGSDLEDDLIFNLHFTGHLTLKDLYN